MLKKLFVGLAVVAMVFAVAPAASAQTAAELNAQLATLMAQLAALQAPTGAMGAGSCTFTRDLAEGVSGTDVTCLQDYLKSTGHFAPTQASTGFFGSITKAGVVAWQQANGISPTAGYFGMKSRAKYSMMGGTGTPSTGCPAGMNCTPTAPAACPAGFTCTPIGGGSPTTGGSLSGGAGSIDDADFISGMTNEEVGEDSEDVEIAGLEVEADDGSDLEITAVRLDFDTGTDTGGSGFSDFEDYASEVSIWLDGEEFARLDADQFNDDNTFDKTISLDSGAIIKAGEVGDLVVAVSGISNLDSTDAQDTWTIIFPQVRFEDADGASVTETSTGDIGTESRTFSFQSFASSVDTEFSVSEGDADINDSHPLPVSTSQETDNVPILSFEVEIEGDADVTVEDLPVGVVVTTETDVDDVITGLTLLMDGEEVGSASMGDCLQNLSSSVCDSTDVGTYEAFLFDDMDLTLEAGQTYEFTVEADFLKADGSPLTEGATIAASTSEALLETSGYADIEDASGEDLVAADITGSASSDAHTVYANAISILVGAADSADSDDATSQAAGGERGVFVIRFDVEAFGEDIYIPVGATIATSSVDTDDGIAYAVENSDGTSQMVNATGLASTTAAVSTTADFDSTSAYYVVREGDTESFTLTITYTALADGFFRGQLDAVNFNVSTAAAADTHLDATPQEDFQTDFEDLDV